MQYMFQVRSARALPATSMVASSLPTAYAAAAPPRPFADPHVALLPYASLSTRQSASAFNQPLSLDTSSVTDMGRMFYVRFARALPAAFILVVVGFSLHVACVAAAAQALPSPGPARHPSPYASLLTRQYAGAFNQSLSLDTSSVTNMQDMFYVRSARALPAASIVGSSLRAACAAATPRHPVSWPSMPPSSYAFLSTRQGANGLSDANKLLIRCAWSDSSAWDGLAWSYLGACSPPPPPSPPLPPFPPGSAPAPPPLPPPPRLPCVDTDNGATSMMAWMGCVSVTPAMCTASLTMRRRLMHDASTDDDDFTASVMCCICGGGYTASPPSAPPPPAPPPYPPGAAPQPPPPYAFTDTASLKTAVQAYNDDPTAATATYGPIAGWCVSAITDMSRLFETSYDWSYYLYGSGSPSNFNADISNWDTSGVTDMNYMFQVRVPCGPEA